MDRKMHWKLLLGLALLSAGCGEVAFKSLWRPADGSGPVWASIPAVQSSGISAKAMNDGRYLYVQLTTDDPEHKQEWMGEEKQNLEIWFDPQNQGAFDRGISVRIRPASSGLSGEQAADLSAAAKSLMVLRPGISSFPREALLDDKDPLATISLRDSTLIYEFKIPLSIQDAHDLSLDAKPGQTVGFKLALSAKPPSRNQKPASQLAADLGQGQDPDNSPGPASGGTPGGRHSHHHGGQGGGGKEEESTPIITGSLELAVGKP